MTRTGTLIPGRDYNAEDARELLMFMRGGTRAKPAAKAPALLAATITALLLSLGAVSPAVAQEHGSGESHGPAEPDHHGGDAASHHGHPPNELALLISTASIPSSLLLTRLARPTASGPNSVEAGAAAATDDLLEVGELRLAPEPSRSYRQGDVIHLTYHLYNPTEADLAAVRQGLQMGLRRAREWLPTGEVQAGGQAYPDEASGVIRLGAWIDTAGPQPGQYTVVALLPNPRARRVPELAENFELLP